MTGNLLSYEKGVAKAYFDNVALSNFELALTCVAAVLLLLF